MKLKVLVVDDSRTSRQLLVQAINASPDMWVIAEADNGSHAIDLTLKYKPDVILMDIVMPERDGLQATREIMRIHPTPIVLISASLAMKETDIAFQAIRAGALTVLQKPTAPMSPTYHDDIHYLLSTLRAMAKVEVIHHWSPRQRTESHAAVNAHPHIMHMKTPAEIVAIVASTGGPAALSEIIKNLPASFPLPIVIAQHIAPDFVPSLAGWLNSVSPLTVRIVEDGETPMPGSVYLAPGNAHIRLSIHRRLVLDRNQGNARYMPSADILLESVGRVYGASAIGVVLTGMGDDGARGLRDMYNAGAFTIAQDEETSVVYGMPQEALHRGGVKQMLPIGEIAQVLQNLTR